MDQNRLDELIDKYATGRITPDEMQELMEWYRSAEIEEVAWPAEQPEERTHLHSRMLLRLQTEIGKSAHPFSTDIAGPGNAASSNAESDNAEPFNPGSVNTQPQVPVIPIGGRSGEHNGGRLRRLNAWKVAASFLLIAGAIWLFRKNIDIPGPIDYITVTNPSGKIQNLRLPDSSFVCLNAQSTIRYAATFGQGKGDAATRAVYLDGEAYFDVVKDPEHPFIVNTRSLSTRVLGTAFDIKAFAGEASTTVSVIRGSVQVSDSTGSLDQLTRARQLRWDARTRKAETISCDTALILGWQQGKLQFSGQTMEEVAATLGRWYNMHFTFADPATGRCRYYLNFTNTLPLRELLSLMKEATDVDYRIDEAQHTVLLTGSPCQ